MTKFNVKNALLHSWYHKTPRANSMKKFWSKFTDSFCKVTQLNFIIGNIFLFWEMDCTSVKHHEIKFFIIIVFVQFQD
jgi:uncharacterized membrane protein YesL